MSELLTHSLLHPRHGPRGRRIGRAPARLRTFGAAWIGKAPYALLGSIILLASPAFGAQSWPQWRGPNRDGHSPALKPLSKLSASIQPIWRREIGPGFSSPVLSGDALIFLEERDGKEVARRLNATDGRDVWSHPFGEAFGDEWGKGPRSTPFLDGDRVYVQSCRGVFRCLSLSDGSEQWGVDYERDFGTVFLGMKVAEGAAPRRGHNGSGLVESDLVIVPAGSTNGATLAALDKKTGAIRWKALKDETAYSSLIAATLAGRRQVIAFTGEALASVDPANGSVLWRVPVKTAAKRHAVSPVLLGEDRIFVASHSYGALCIKVEASGDKIIPRELWRNPALKINLSTPTAVGGYLYGLGAAPEFICLDGSSGKIVWAQPGFGQGIKADYAATLAVGNQLLVLNESGQLTMAAANSAAFTSLGQAQVCGKTWSHPAYADGRLYVRDGRSLQCFDLADTSASARQ